MVNMRRIKRAILVLREIPTWCNALAVEMSSKFRVSLNLGKFVEEITYQKNSEENAIKSNQKQKKTVAIDFEKVALQSKGFFTKAQDCH